MTPKKTFPVFGETVEIFVTSEETKGSFCILVQTSPPGGGPPPHFHQFEDEIFTPIEGEYELFDGKQWNNVPLGQNVHTLRGETHTFRNAGTTTGKMQCIAIGGKLDEYLEAISPLALPDDMAKVLEISAKYGISFLPPA